MGQTLRYFPGTPILSTNFFNVYDADLDAGVFLPLPKKFGAVLAKEKLLG